MAMSPKITNNTIFLILCILLVPLVPKSGGFCCIRKTTNPPSSSLLEASSVSTTSNDKKKDATSATAVRKDFFTEAAVRGPSLDTKPDYESIHGPLGPYADSIFLSVFRNQLADKTGIDSSREIKDYRGIIDIALQMNAQFSNRTEIQFKAQEVLVSLFPSWMPPWYSILFSKPFPAFSSRMNAWATLVAGTWLMGECELNDVEIDNNDDDSGQKIIVGKDQGLLVKRCRFLEESGCASVCVNSCKVPTQNFFMQNMGLPLTMEPNYETFECQFSFGKTPGAETEILAKSTPCLSRCPTAGALRKYHDDNNNKGAVAAAAAAAKTSAVRSNDGDNDDIIIDNPCKLMEN